MRKQGKPITDRVAEKNKMQLMSRIPNNSIFKKQETLRNTSPNLFILSRGYAEINALLIKLMKEKIAKTRQFKLMQLKNCYSFEKNKMIIDEIR